jgi:two-component system chemotaxis response regulator CheY
MAQPGSEVHQAMLFEPSYDDAGFVRLWLAERRVEVVEWTRVGDGWTHRWRQKKPLINIIELVLPRMDGMACLKKLKAFDPETRVILVHSMTGKWGSEITLKAMTEGADAVVPKPYTKERFMASLDYVLARGGRKMKKSLAM